MPIERAVFHSSSWVVFWTAPGEAPPPPGHTPIASFVVTAQASGLLFDASASSEPGGSIASYTWSFGDGTKSVTNPTPTVTHAYAKAGTYTVSLVVTDPAGVTAETAQQVNSASVSKPVAAFTADESGLVVNVDASASTDTGSSITSYAWTFGDGATSTGVTQTHTYTNSGTYSITLTVTDGLGATSTATRSVTAVGGPTAAFTTKVTTLTVNVDASSSSGPNPLSSFSWNWGDGTTALGRTAAHTYTLPGTYSITLTVFDASGLSDTQVNTVTVSTTAQNQPPVAAFSYSTTAQSVTFDGSASSDPDAGIIYDLPNSPAPHLGLTFTLSQPSGMQCAVPSPDTGYWYVSQRTNGSNGTTTPYENLTINRCNGTTGALVDSMTITDGGHGTGFALEYTASVLYIWIAIQVPAATGGTTWDICRFPYKAGTFTRAQVSGLAVMYRNSQIGTGGKAHVSFDVPNGYCVTYDEINQTQNIYKRWLLSDFLAKKLTQVGPTITDTRPNILQGWAGSKDSLFIYTGAQDGMNGTTPDDLHLREFSWLDGSVLSDWNLTGMGSTNGTYPTGHWEAESCIMYQPTGQSPTVYLGLTLGAPSTPHTFPIYLSTLAVKPPIASYAWNFGDGTTGTGKTATHKYTNAGSYSVTLTVTDNWGATNTASKSVSVGTTIIPKFSHIIDVWMENHSETQIFGSSSAPYINSLANASAKFTNAQAIAHPSQPNYIAAFSGSTQGVTDDNNHDLGAIANLYTQVTAAGKTMKGYVEATGVRKHNPWESFSNATACEAGFSTFPSSSNYSTLPALSWVVPNLTDDMHDGTVQQGDTWLQTHIDPLIQWAKSNNSLVIIRWDEDDSSATNGNDIPVILAGANVQQGIYTGGITHYDLLGLCEDSLGLPRLGNASGLPPLSAPFVAVTPPVASFTTAVSGGTVTVDGSASSSSGGTISSYAWNFGDGATATGAKTSHTYSASGTYTITLTVTDSKGLTGSTTKSVTATVTTVSTVPYLTYTPGSTAADMQCTVKAANGHVFATQPHTEPDGVTQSTRITRMTSAGVMIDQMVLNGAGHGTSIGIEITGGVEYIWATWSQPTLTNNTISNDIVRFPWPASVGTAGTRFDRSAVVGLTTKIPGAGSYRNVQFDWVNNFALIRVSGGTSDVYQQHPLSNVLAGNISSPSHTITLTQSTNSGVDGRPTPQGFATYMGSFFRYTGAPSDVVGGDPSLVTEYAWSTGAVLRTINVSNLDNPNGAPVGGKREPESCTLYNVDGSAPLLLIGVVTGPSGTHGFDLFSLALPPNVPNPPPPPPPPGNVSKSPWTTGSPTEGFPSGVQVIKARTLQPSGALELQTMINALSSDAVIDISGQQVNISTWNGGNLAAVNGGTHFLGLLGGISNGVFDNQVTVKANIFPASVLTAIQGNQSGTSQYAMIRTPAAIAGGKAVYFMGVHFVGADQGNVTDSGSATVKNGPARYKGIDMDLAAPGLFQNCFLEAMNYSDGSTPPWEVGQVDSRRSHGFTVRRVEMSGQLPVGSSSRPSSSTADPFGHNWIRSGGFQWNADYGTVMQDFSIHDGLVSGLTYSIAGSSNNSPGPTGNNSGNITLNNLYVENQSQYGFSGVNLESCMGYIHIDHPTIKMNSSGGNHIGFNARLGQVAPTISSANFVITEPTWSGGPAGTMFSIRIAGQAQWSQPPTVIKNGVKLSASTSTGLDPTKYYHVSNVA